MNIKLYESKNKMNKTLFLEISCIIMLLSIFNNHCQAQGTWTQVTATAPHQNVGGFMVLSDGSVLCKSNSGGTPTGDGNLWDKLTPDIHGSYINGTWSTIAAMQRTRIFFSSQMLMDGRVYVAGGEYGTDGTQAGAHGEVYNPLTNAWTQCPAPGHIISDANSEILPNGTVLQGTIDASYPTTTIIYNPTTNTYSAGPTSHAGQNESAWMKLPDNSILYVDEGAQTSERFIPSLNQWVVDANVPVSLYQASTLETGPCFLLPNGKAIFFGCPHTAIYTPSGNNTPGTWVAGPDIPGGHATDDAPGAMMVNGNILIAADVPSETAPTFFYEYNYLTNAFTQVGAPGGGTSLAGISSYQTTMVDLPNGQVLFGVGQAGTASAKYYVYTPSGSPLVSGKPTISNITQTSCTNFSITGTLFNGISEGACYGDDFQMASNYPLVRLSAGGNVYYARTSNWNSTGVMRGSAPDTTQFTIPSTLPHQAYYLVVVANGIASDSMLFYPWPLLSSTLSPPAICSNSTFTYTPASYTSGATFTWTRAAVSGISNAAVTTPQASNPNEVLINTTTSPKNVVYSFVIFANGCSDTQSVTVVVNPTPVATITGNPTTFCQGGSVALTSSAGSSYLWNTGETTSSISVNATGNYTVQITNTYGCSAISTVTAVTVNPLPTASITANGPTTFCQGGSVTLTSSAGSSYLWNTGETNSSITVNATGNYSVQITNTYGCSATSTVTAVTVNPLPTSIITANGPTTFCLGGSVTLTSNAGSSYLWNTGETTSSISVNATGNYSVQITNTYGCSTTSTVTAVTVNPLPTASITANGPTIFCIGGSVTLTSSAGSSYLWNTGETTSSITVNATGNYTVQITNSYGCSATSTVTAVTVNPLPNLSVNALDTIFCLTSPIAQLTGLPNGGNWTGNGVNGNHFDPSLVSPGSYPIVYRYTDGNGCSNTDTMTMTVNLCTDAIQLSYKDEIIIYPNPVNDYLNIQLSKTFIGMKSTVLIIDEVGRTICKMISDKQDLKIGVSNFVEGIYFYELMTENSISMGKFIISR